MTDFSSKFITLSDGASIAVGSQLNYNGFSDPSGGLWTDQHTADTLDPSGTITLNTSILHNGNRVDPEQISDLLVDVVYDNGNSSVTGIPALVIDVRDHTTNETFQLLIFQDTQATYGNVSQVTIAADNGDLNQTQAVNWADTGVGTNSNTSDYVVSGTDDDNVISAENNYADGEGDKIDNNDHSDGSNDDSVHGGGGNDNISSGFGNDTVDGGIGNDTIVGGSGDDSLMGGDGDDSIGGDTGNDTLIGGAGADTLNGGAGDDHIYGGSGDVVDGNLGFATDPNDTDQDTLYVDNVDNITITGADSNGNGYNGVVTFLDQTELAFSEIENFMVDGQAWNPPGGGGEGGGSGGESGGTTVVYDLIQMNGTPTTGATFTKANGDLIEVDEPITFTNQTAGEMNIGDTAVIDGVTFTVTNVYAAGSTYTHDNGSGTQTTNDKSLGLKLVEQGGTKGNQLELDYLIPQDGKTIEDITEINFFGVDDYDATSTYNTDVFDGQDSVTIVGGTEGGGGGREFLLYDAIEIQGGVPTAGATLTTSGGELVEVDEPIKFTTTSTSKEQALTGGETTTIDGIEYTVVELHLGMNDVTHSGGTEKDFDFGTILLEAADGSQLTYLVPADATPMPEITSISINTIGPAKSVAAAGFDDNDNVTLDAGGTVVNVYDAIQFTGGMPADNSVMTTDSGQLVSVNDTLKFEAASPGELAVGDTVEIGGVQYTVNQLNAAKTNVEHDDGGTTTPVELIIVSVGSQAGTLQFMIPPDGQTLENITSITTLSTGANAKVFKSSLVDDNDSVTLSTKPAPDYIVSGTSGDDTINSAYDRDPEGDEVDNNDAADGSNDDVVQAGAGDDYVNAGAGDNAVYGGEGDDYLFSGSGSGDDSLYGESGDDQIVVDTSSGSNTIVGGETGETAGDTILINSDSPDPAVVDLTSADAEAGTITDGANTTTFSEIEVIELSQKSLQIVKLADGSGIDVVHGFQAPRDNGDGTYTPQDQLDVSGMTDGTGSPVDTDDVTVTDTNGDGTGDAILTFPNGESITLVGVTPDRVDSPEELEAMGIPAAAAPPSDYIVSGTTGNDSIGLSYTGDPENDRVDNNDALDGSNDDVIKAGAGDDYVYAGQGNDEVYGEDGNDTLFGMEGNDSVYGGAGNDSVDGETGDDFLDGGAGDDSLVGDEGADTMKGGEGHDTFYEGQEDGSGDQVFGEGGNDTVYMGGGNDTIDGGVGNDSLSGGDDDDSILGGDGDDTLEGGDGSDTLKGGEGDDSVQGGSGEDHIYGGSGDTVDGGTDDLNDPNAPNDLDTLYVDNVQSVNITGPDSNGNGYDGTVSFLDGTSMSFAEIEKFVVDGQPWTPPSSGDLVIYDLIQLSGGAPIDGDNLTVADGELVEVDEPVTFNLQDNTQVQTGDTATIDGVTYTVSTVQATEAVYTQADGSTHPLKSVTVTLDDATGTEPSITYVIPYDSATDLSLITEIDVAQIHSNSAHPVETIDDNNTVTLGSATNTLNVYDAIELAGGLPADGANLTTAGGDLVEVDEPLAFEYTGALFGAGATVTIDGVLYTVDQIHETYANFDYNEGASSTNDTPVLSVEMTGDGGQSLVYMIPLDGHQLPDITELTVTAIDPIPTSGGADPNRIDTDDNVTLHSGQPLNFIVSGDGSGNLIDGAYDGDPEGDMIDAGDNQAGNDDDVVEAGGGDDTINAGAGDDSIMGEDGDDLIVVTGQLDNDTVVGGEGGETNGDTLDLSALGDDITVTFSGPETGTVTDGNNTTHFSEIENIVLGDGNDSVTGSSGDENVDTGGGDDWVDTGAGDDTVIGGDGNDDINVGEGNNFVDSSDGNGAPDQGDPTNPVSNIDADPSNDLDTVTSGSGNDTIWTGDDADVIFTTGGDNQLDGGWDDDTITAGAGADTIQGGEGRDLIKAGDGDDLIGGGSSSTGAQSVIDMPDDTDPLTTNDTDTIYAEGGNDVVFAGDDADLVYGGTGNDSLHGMADDDKVFGEEGDDLITGGHGADKLDGGAGADSIRGDEGNDSIYGGAGEDTLEGGADDDIILGGIDDDRISGGTGDDKLDGEEGNDTIMGDDGEDTIFGGENADDISGGEGNDLIYGDDGDNTTSTDFSPTVGWGGFDGTHSQGDPFTGGSQQYESVTVDSSVDNGPFTSGGQTYESAVHNGSGGVDLITDGDNGPVTQTICFDTPATFVTFSVADIDANFDDPSTPDDDNEDFWQDSVQILAYDEAGNAIPVTLNAGGNLTVDPSTNTATATEDYQASGGEASNALGVTINGAISKIEIIYSSNIPSGDLPRHVEVSEMEFGISHDDNIEGGAGNDTIYGEEGGDFLAGEDGTDELYGGDGNDLLEGGADADTVVGGSGNDTIVGATDGDVLDGSTEGSDVDVLDVSGQNVEITTFTQDADGDSFSGSANILDGAGGVIGTFTFSEIEQFVGTSIPCFTPGTRIKTAQGEMPVEEVQPGTRVLTRDNGYQTVVWAGRRDIVGSELAAQPALNPIRIKAGALGDGLPERDMLVSPQHRVLIGGARTELWFGEDEVLVPAKFLTVLDGVDEVAAEEGVSYIHFMFEAHEVVMSDGCWTESFQPGDLTLGAIGSEARAEIIALFPELETGDAAEVYPAARATLTAHQAKVLLAS
ncbi:Hint domain-containing protein [Pseudaestuariivita sp.]|uniref:Hint domain-containing protein n=1 Tax=Pseudaestuariivita sp. TaxID=2211669 RepID=UPI004059F148